MKRSKRVSSKLLFFVVISSLFSLVNAASTVKRSRRISSDRISHLENPKSERGARVDSPRVVGTSDSCEDVCNQIHILQSDLEEHNDIVCSKIGQLEKDHKLLCSKLEDVRINPEDINLLCSKIEEVDRDLEDHNSTVCDKLINIDIDISNVDVNISRICSKVEDIDEDLEDHNSIVCSKLENISEDISDSRDIICSKIEDVREDISDLDGVVRDEFEDLREQLEMHDMEVEDAHMDISSKIEKVEADLGRHDTRVCSKIEKVESDLSDHDESICSKLEVAESQLDMVSRTLCDKLIDLDINVESSFDYAESQLDAVSMTICDKIKGVDDKLDLLTESTLEGIMDIMIDLDSICDKVLDTMGQIDELSDDVAERLSDLDEMLEVVKDKVCIVDSKVDVIDDELEEHDERICSKIENLDEDLEAHNELICSKIEDLAEKITCDVYITQADIQGGSVGFEIDQADTRYCLGENIDISSNTTGILVTADNVMLDLNGYTIDGGNTATTGIKVDGVTLGVIKNANIINIDGTAIDIDPSSDIKISNVSVVGSNGHGIVIKDASSNVIVEDCTVTLATNNAFHVEGSSRCIFRRCIGRQSGRGFYIGVSSLNNCFIDCKAQNNDTQGYMTGSSDDNTLFIRCSAQENGGDGFIILGDNSVLYDCIAQDNSGDGFDIGTAGSPIGVALVRCSAIGNTENGFEIDGQYCVIRHSLAQNNGGGSAGGFLFESTADNCELRDCSAVGNAAYGIKAEGAAIGTLLVCNNTSQGTVAGEDFDLVDVEDSNLCNGQHKICSKLENLEEDLDEHDARVCSKLELLSDNVDQGFTDTASQIDVQTEILCSKIETHDANISEKIGQLSEDVDQGFDETASLIDDAKEVLCSKMENLEADLEAHNATVCEKIASLSDDIDQGFTNTDSLIDNAKEVLCSKIEVLDDCFATPIYAQTIISESGHYCLANDIVFSSGYAITIDADNVVLDLNGHTLDGTGGGQSGVLVNTGNTKIIIKNGFICNSTRGIEILSGNVGVKILDIAVGNTTQNGIEISSSDDIYIQNTTSMDSANGDGFAVSGTSLIVFDACVASSNAGRGFFLDETENACLISCKAVDNESDGFRDSGTGAPNNSQNNNFSKCVAQNNGLNGFQIQGVHDVLSECLVQDNTQHGFNILGDDCTLENCKASENTLSGYRIDGNQAALMDCYATLNGTGGDDLGSGFTIDGLSAVLRRCIAQENGFKDTTPSSSTGGFHFTTSADFCELRDSSAVRNNGTGIRADSPGDATLVVCNNTAHDNGAGDTTYDLVNVEDTNPCNIADALCSKLQKLETDLDMHDERICSKIEAHDATVCDKFVSLSDQVETGFDNLESQIDEQTTTICSKVEAHDATVCDKFVSLSDQVETGFDNLESQIDEQTTTICSKVEAHDATVSDKFVSLSDQVETGFDNLESQIDEQTTTICSKIEAHDATVGDKFVSLSDQVKTGFDNLESQIDEQTTTICSKIEAHDATVCDKFVSLSDQVEQGFTNTDSLIDNAKEVLCSKIEVLDDCFAIPIYEQTIISESGHYCLANDITFTSGDAITIDADNVVLDLNGHTLDGNSQGDCGVKVTVQSKIVIKNGYICNGLDSGVCISGAGTSNIYVQDVVSVNNNIGFEVGNTNLVVLENCVASDNAAQGFSLSSTENACLIACKAVENGTYGFQDFGASVNNNFSKCVAQGNGTSGTFSGFSTVGVHDVLSECVAQDNTDHGFYIDADDCTLENCKASQNTNSGYYIKEQRAALMDCYATLNGVSGTGSGFTIEGQSAVLRRCISQDNGTDSGNATTSTGGFYFMNAALNSELRDSSAVHNNGVGIRADAPASASLVVCNNTSHANGPSTTYNLVNVVDSDLCTLNSTFNSQLEKIEENLSIHDVMICSKIEAHDATVSDKFVSLSDQVQTGFDNLETQIDGQTASICDKVISLTEVLETQIDQQAVTILDKFVSLSDQVETGFDNLETQIDGQTVSICDKVISLTEVLETQIDQQTVTISDKFVSLSDQVQTGFDNLETQIDGQTASICDKVISLTEVLETQIDQQTVTISDKFVSLSDQVQTGFDSLETQIDGQTSTLCSKIEVIDSKFCPNKIIITAADIAAGYTTPSANTVYCLEESATFGSGITAIIVNQDNVVIDLGGNTLNGQSVASIGIDVNGASNVIIKNGTIENAMDGSVYTRSNTAEVTIEDITVITSGDVGFLLSGTSHQLHRCSANGNDYGYRINTSNSIFKECTALSNTNIGFYLVGTDSSYNCLIRCTAIDNGSAGANDGGFIGDSSANSLTGNSYIKCIAKRNDGNGFRTADDQNTLIKQCVSAGNTSNGILIGVNNTIVKECCAIKNGGSGIVINSAVENYQIIGCKVANNTAFGIDNNSAATNPAIYNNLSHGNATQYDGIIPFQEIAASLTDAPGYWANLQPDLP